MPVYFIGDVIVRDAAAHEEYRRATTDLIARQVRRLGAETADRIGVSR